jgi:uncharacterized membrane protein HdeD (DUF308 family)
MSDDPTRQLDRLRHDFAAAMRAHWKLLLAQGIAMIVLGLLAVLLPNLATLAVEILVGTLFLAGGLIRLITLTRCRTAPGFWWSVALAVLATLLGAVLLAQPMQGTLTLTMVLLAFFVAEGIATIIVALQVHRPMRNWAWTLFSGVIDLVLAYLIWHGWPGSAAWAIGLLVGINMFFLGMSLAMTAIAAR